MKIKGEKFTAKQTDGRDFTKPNANLKGRVRDRDRDRWRQRGGESERQRERKIQRKQELGLPNLRELGLSELAEPAQTLRNFISWKCCSAMQMVGQSYSVAF